MDENNELLDYIYSASEMGKNTITQTLKSIKQKDNKIKKCAEDILKGYEKFYKLSCNKMKKSGYSGKKSSLMAKMGANMGVRKEVDKDNSDARIASMIIEGLTMGVVEISVKIENYKHIVSKDNLSLATDFLNFQENAIEKLKSYL